jgi:hypothetical protein
MREGIADADDMWDATAPRSPLVAGRDKARGIGRVGNGKTVQMPERRNRSTTGPITLSPRTGRICVSDSSSQRRLSSGSGLAIPDRYPPRPSSRSSRLPHSQPAVSRLTVLVWIAETALSEKH